MFAEHGRGDAVGLLHLPLPALAGDDPQAGGGGGVLEPEGALLAVEGGDDPLDDRHLGASVELCGNCLTGPAGPLAVVGADEWRREPSFGEDLGIEPVVDVDDEDAGVGGPLEGRHDRLGVGRRDDDRRHAAGHHLLDERDLLGDVGFASHPVGDQLVAIARCGLMGLRPVGHRREKLVGQRLHHQGDARLAVGLAP